MRKKVRGRSDWKPGSLRVTLQEAGDQLRLWGGDREAVRWGSLLTEHRQGIAHWKYLARLKNSPTEESWKLPLNKIS